MEFQHYEWLVTALAEEIAADAGEDADALVARLRARLAYASADPGFGAAERAEQARIFLVERIAGRLERRRKAAAAPVQLVRRDDIAA
jgi:hypothetical protein